MALPVEDGERARDWLRRAARLAGYGLMGFLTTAAVALVVLNLAQPVQPVVYDLVYLGIGPSGAMETAIFTHYLLAVGVGLTLTLVAGDALGDRLDNATAIGAASGAMLAVPVTVPLLALAGARPFLPTVGVLAVVLVGVPVALWLGYGVRSGAVPAFVGAIPAVLLLLALAMFDIGWGWGYVLTAEEVRSPGGDVVADFDEVPSVGEDLFEAGDCETTDDRRRCRLPLRGYEHERTAARFMARHGTRCPYRGRSPGFVATHDGTPYRVTCLAHGD